jgi:hypothetical protein
MTTDKIFLPHLHNSLRRKIAICYAQQEMRKLLPQIRNINLWQSIDNQIENWYKELSIRNFWNAIHGISMGFRLKSLVPWMTSLHMNWVEKDISIEELWFGGKFGPIVSLKIPDEILESAAEVKKRIFQTENKKIFRQTRKKLKELAIESAPRDNFPIFVVRKNGKLRVIDGNRRLLRAIIFGKEKIRAMAGEPAGEPALFEHWVPTSLLVDLVFWHKRQIQNGRDTTDTMARTIAELIRDSSAGRIEFSERAIHRDDKIHMRLLKAVVKILKEYNILLKIPK